MIFKQVQQVLDGTKTQTRRPVKLNEQLWWVALVTGERIGTVNDFDSMGYYGYRPPFSDLTVLTLHPVDGHIYLSTSKVCPHRVKWVVGKTYAVQPGRGKKAVGRIRITKIRREAVQSISEADCLAEGVAHRKYIQNPMQKWSGYYVPDDRVLTEPVICGHAYARICYQVLWDSIHRKPYRWGDNPECWILDFERSEG